MGNTQPEICRKITAIQLGLLRYMHNGKKMTLHVKIAVTDEDTLSCVVPDNLPAQPLLNRDVTLIQKDHDNYMYIGGRISKEVRRNKLVLSIDLTKACWFVRKKRGSITWLQEKCIYLPDEIKMAS